MTSSGPIIFVVDDDDAVRDSVTWLLEPLGYEVRGFASAQDFLSAYRFESPACLILDVRMPGMSGLELQSRLRANRVEIPILFITGHADVGTAVRAMKDGATDFLEKPFSDQVLLDRVHACIESDRARNAATATNHEMFARYNSLTERQQRVLELVAQGKANRDIGAALGISIKTVEAHRARLMRRMMAQSMAELVLMADACARRKVPRTNTD